MLNIKPRRGSSSGGSRRYVLRLLNSCSTTRLARGVEGADLRQNDLQHPILHPATIPLRLVGKLLCGQGSQSPNQSLGSGCRSTRETEVLEKRTDSFAVLTCRYRRTCNASPDRQRKVRLGTTYTDEPMAVPLAACLRSVVFQQLRVGRVLDVVYAHVNTARNESGVPGFSAKDPRGGLRSAMSAGSCRSKGNPADQRQPPVLHYISLGCRSKGITGSDDRYDSQPDPRRRQW